jgi:hypothetical protein
MAEQLPTPANDRPAIARMIDGAYLACVRQETALKHYLMDPRGPLERPYLDFYEVFSFLFTLTTPYREILDEDDTENNDTVELAKEIAGWLDPRSTAITAQKAYTGLSLFSRWQKVLARKEVISWRS